MFIMESIALHEAIPGHHFQIALAQELGGSPWLRKQSQDFCTAYIEGWGLYTEKLGMEMGFYSDPCQDFGRLTTEMMRAVRLVIDSGLHAKNWTRQQVVLDFLFPSSLFSIFPHLPSSLHSPYSHSPRTLSLVCGLFQGSQCYG